MAKLYSGSSPYFIFEFLVSSFFFLDSILNKPWLFQVNVNSTVQRRKARAFDGFKRSAVVTVPSESDFEEYVKKLEENPIRDTPLTILELKSTWFYFFSFISLIDRRRTRLKKKLRKMLLAFEYAVQSWKLSKRVSGHR